MLPGRERKPERDGEEGFPAAEGTPKSGRGRLCASPDPAGNGNLGTGVAIMGAFSLVRFWSVPGTSREISGVFYAIVVGLATGMGYLAYAAMITVIVGAVMLVSYKVVGRAGVQQHLLRIVISEDLDYEGVFEDILQKYTKTARLIQVKTINMGSMYELRYEIALAKDAFVKEMIDDIRTRNANLMVSCSRVLTSREELQYVICQWKPGIRNAWKQTGSRG